MMRTCCALIAWALVWPPTALTQVRQSGQPQGNFARYPGWVVSTTGLVEGNTLAQKQWVPVEINDFILNSQQVKTNVSAEAAIVLWQDKELRVAQAGMIRFLADSISLEYGKAWIRNRDAARPLRILTPGGVIKTTGTEIVIEARPGNVTVVTVLHGSVNLANNAGNIDVPAGFEGTAVPGTVPTRRQLLNPEDAVQWILYYPTELSRFDFLQAVPPGAARSALERSLTLSARGDYAGADSALSTPALGALEVQRLTQRAIIKLRSGQVTIADTLLRQALATDPAAVRPLVLFARQELIRNQKDSAQHTADVLLAAHPQSVDAHILAGEIAQASFRLDKALEHFDRALTIDSTDVHALVNRARVRFGSGDTRGATIDVRRAASLDPASADVSSLEGFLSLARDDIGGARAAFDTALARDSRFAEAHLGRGLLAFKLGEAEVGRREMIAATLLEPRVSLYHSYLGKAYHQLKRHREALAALELAKAADPRDPTPWLYSALIYRDLNQQGRALTELRGAIARNDNRAVYRSRLLLDRDVATKNVNLAQIYKELGFDAWAAHEGLNSQAADPTNASAHAFLAQAFTDLPDRVQAQGSELLQYRLNAPVNQNSFNTFNEYTALFEQPRTTVSSSLEAGLLGRMQGEQVVNGGNDRVAYFGYLGMWAEDGARPTTPDKRLQGTMDLAFAAGPNTNLIASYTLADKKRGSDEDEAVTVGASTGRPLSIREVSLVRDTNDSFRDKSREAMLGVRHSFSPSTMIQSAVTVDWVTGSQFTPDFAVDLDPDPNTVDLYQGTLLYTAPFVFYDGGIQAIHHRGAQTIILGASAYRTNLRTSNAFDLRNSAGERAAVSFADTIRDEGVSAWLRHEADLGRLHTIAGVQLKSDHGHNWLTDSALVYRRADPFLGLSLRLTPTTVIRTAAFRSLNSTFVGASIAPSTVAGFVVARNELPYVSRREADLSIERSGDRSFQMVQLSTRRSDNAMKDFSVAWSNANRVDYYFNYLITPRWGLAASNSFVRNETDRYTSNDNLAQGSLTFVHPSGIAVHVTDSYISQTFVHTDIPELKDAGYNLTDVTWSYELPGKRAKATVTISNIFDRKFTTLLEGLMFERPRPQRHGSFTLAWRY